MKARLKPLLQKADSRITFIIPTYFILVVVFAVMAAVGQEWVLALWLSSFAAMILLFGFHIFQNGLTWIGKGMMLVTNALFIGFLVVHGGHGHSGYFWVFPLLVATIQVMGATLGVLFAVLLLGMVWQLDAFGWTDTALSSRFYFAALGILLPYWSLYLRSLGFDALAIGQLMAVIMITKLIAPNIWGWIADHSGQRIAVIRLASLMSLLVFSVIFWTRSFWAIAAVMAFYSFFWNASLPQFEVITLNWLGSDTHRYGLIRLWGSVGFIAAVGVAGLLLDHYPISIVPVALLLVLGGILASSLLVGEGGQVAHADHVPVPLMSVLRQPAVAAFLVSCFLMQAGHGVYYTFFSIWMTDVGYSKGQTGAFWALGVLSEVALFLVMHHLMRCYDARRLVFASLLIAAVRWLLIGLFPASLLLVLAAQVLHAVTFGVFHAAAIQLVHDFFPGRLQGRGQALYSSLSFGAGGAIGSLAGGWLWDVWSPLAAFVAASGVSLLAAGIVFRWLPPGGSQRGGHRQRIPALPQAIGRARQCLPGGEQKRPETHHQRTRV